MTKIKLREATDEQIAQNIFDHAEDWGITGIVGDTEGFEVEVFERGEDYIYVYISGVWHRLKSKFTEEVIIPGQIEVWFEDVNMNDCIEVEEEEEEEEGEIQSIKAYPDTPADGVGLW